MMKIKSYPSTPPWTIALLSLFGILFFQGEALSFRPVSVSKNNVALGGYDTVAYFTEGRPIKGSPMYRVEWLDAYWYFSSKTNKRLFEENPEKYAPAFGGYCSYSIGQGKATSCDPEAFLIKGGKLYVVKDKEVLKVWSEDFDSNLVKARDHWKKLNQKAKQ